MTIRVGYKAIFCYLSGFKETEESKEELIFLIKSNLEILKNRNRKSNYSKKIGTAGDKVPRRADSKRERE